jgi:hypothetical protein
MTKSELQQKVITAKEDIVNAIMIMYNALNSGQQKKILKDEQVALLFERYNIKVDE